MKNNAVLESLTNRLIVSVQANADSPLRDPHVIARMAAAAVAGGAVGIRCGGVGGIPDIEAVRSAVDVPVVGLTKEGHVGVYITPTVKSANAVVAAGADIVAFDGTARTRPDGSSVADIAGAIHARGKLAMADISTLEEGVNASRAGADLVSSTLAGYTDYSSHVHGPDIELIAKLRSALPDAFLVAEGRYALPEQCAEALAKGASAIVVGTAITDVAAITRTFIENGGFELPSRNARDGK